MRFPYLALPTRRPVYPLGGAMVRHRPIVPLALFGPLGSLQRWGSVDSSADDTVFPLAWAQRLGIDLRGAPQGEAGTVGQQVITYPYARITLQLSDGVEAYSWEAIAGFVAGPRPWGLLGQAGFLEFFDVNLLTGRREVVITPSSSFVGRQIGP